MPDGKLHALGTGTVTSAIVACGLYFGLPPEITGYMALGSLATLVINPDLDQAEARSGCLAAIFYPYGKLIPHRSWLSHLPIVGTILRVGYLYGLVWILSYLIEVHLGYRIWIPSVSLGIVAGMMLSDTFHAFLDVVDSKIKT